VSNTQSSLFAKLYGYPLFRWYKLSLDVVPSGASKARGVESILNFLGLSPSEAVAFGDALNDRGMLSYVDGDSYG
jgi:hydroxymethylpyrimidine pyrophosphatase-like HAD family hydrolase